ncbi:MAG: LysR substrate-binding domain-containing protein [Burkholderiaceae bacterium]|nr:LysR substrate-binding domain-containing protein [Burkholderiaceae bacterium]
MLKPDANTAPAGAGAFESLDPNALALVATLAEAGSLSAAARRLGLSQPALTKQLHRIEQALGVSLFERSIRGIRLTDEGLALLPHARVICDQAARARQELADRRGGHGAAIRVALSHLATMVLLPRVMPRFRQQWPQVEVRIGSPVYPERFYGLREGSPDFAIVPLPISGLPVEYSARRMYPTTLAAVVRAGHPLAHARCLREAAGAEWVVPGTASTSAAALRRAFETEGLPPPSCPVSCETLTGLEALVASTDLIGIIPIEVYELRSATTGLCRIAAESSIEGPSLAMVRWADAHPTRPARELAELFIESAHALARERSRRARSGGAG